MNKIKQLFHTPKKAVLTVSCIVGILAVLAVGTVFATEKAAKRASIGEESAQNFAFADAGVDPVSATNVHTEFDREQGQFIYDVDFVSGNTEYEYWIKASDGSVVKKDSEIIGQDDLPDDKEAAQSSGTTGNTVTDDDSSTADADIEKAKETAFADAKVQVSEVTCTKAELTEDDGVEVYDIEFYTADKEYEYEIRVSDGKIYQKEEEPLDDDKKVQTEKKGNYIGIDKAKEIAVKHAGFSVADVRFSKAKLEEDDGNKEYEIEFYKNKKEYEYKIQAETGDILEYDSDREDD